MNEKDLRKKFNQELEEKQSDEDIFEHPINKDVSPEEKKIWNLLIQLYGLTYERCVKMVDEKPEVYACKTNPYTEGAPYGMSFYPSGKKSISFSQGANNDGVSSKKEIRVRIENNIDLNYPRNKRCRLIIGGTELLGGKIEPLTRNIYVSFDFKRKQYQIITEYATFWQEELRWQNAIKEKNRTQEQYEEYKNNLFEISPLYNEYFSSIESLENFLIKIVTKQITDDFNANR